MIKGWICLLLFSLLLPLGSVTFAHTVHIDLYQRICGAASTYLPAIVDPKQNTWELVKIIPGQFSGCATPSGFATISGSYVVVGKIDAPISKSSGIYTWSLPNITIRSAIGLRDSATEQSNLSSIFSSQIIAGRSYSTSRYVICMLNENASGTTMFRNVHVVPDDWYRYVMPAIAYLRAHPLLSNLPATASTRSQLENLLKNPNPYLVLTAFQTLSASKNLSRSDMSVALSSPSVILAASCMTLAQLYSWTDVGSNDNWLFSQISAAESISQLESIYTGIMSASPSAMTMCGTSTANLPPTTVEYNEKYKKFILNATGRISRRLKELDPSGKVNESQWYMFNVILQ